MENPTLVRAAGTLVGIILLLACGSAPAWAEGASDEPLSDKLMIRGGWAYVFGATTNVSVGGPVLGLGTSLDLTQTLGVRDSTDALRIDTLYRFNEHHAIGFSWYRIGLSGQKNLNQQIQIGDQTISAGAFTQTSLSFNTWRLLYDWSFYRNDKVELAVSPGLYMMEVKFNFAGQGTINNTAGAVTLVNEQLTVPLPSLGLVLNYNITPKLQFQSRYDFFYLTMANYSGAMFELYGGLEYRIVKHFAMGAAYDRLSANLRGDQPQAGFQANFSYNLAYVYATLYLF
jgi:hypothetical protein